MQQEEKFRNDVNEQRCYKIDYVLRISLIKIIDYISVSFFFSSRIVVDYIFF